MAFIRIKDRIINTDVITEIKFKANVKLKKPFVDETGREQTGYQSVNFSQIKNLNAKFKLADCEAIIYLNVVTGEISGEDYISGSTYVERIVMEDKEAIALWDYFHGNNVTVLVDK